MHAKQFVRDEAVPPSVYDPAVHLEHVAAPASLYMLSAPQALHDVPYVPAEQAVAPPPSQVTPAGHLSHLCLVVSVHVVPSLHDVLLPFGHVEHVAAPTALYLNADPRPWQPKDELCFPAGHRLLVFVPSHDQPSWHDRQLVRVAESPPVV